MSDTSRRAICAIVGHIWRALELDERPQNKWTSKGHYGDGPAKNFCGRCFLNRYTGQYEPELGDHYAYIRNLIDPPPKYQRKNDRQPRIHACALRYDRASLDEPAESISKRILERLPKYEYI